MAKEILITGMEGMTGSWLARVAVDRELVVCGTHHPDVPTSNIDPLIKSGQVTVFSCDLTNGADVKNLLGTMSPDVLFHLAGKTNNPQSWLDDTLQVNIAMCSNILQELGKRGHKPRIVLASTVNVYGPQFSEKPFSEDHSINPDTPYALRKAVQEKLLDLYGKRLGLDVIIARPSQYTGPGRASGFVEYEIAEQILRIEKNETPASILLRNAAAEVDLLDVRDVVNAYLLLAQKGGNGEAYNIVSGRGTSVQKIAELMIAASCIEHKDRVTIRSTGKEKPSPAKYTNKKLILLGWKPKRTLDQTLQGFLDWMRGGETLPVS